MAQYSFAYRSEAFRTRLRKLDRLLDDLEDLNLRDMNHIPTRVGSDLQDCGVNNPYRWSIAELIDRVFELQEPLLETLSTRRAEVAAGLQLNLRLPS